MKIDKGADGYEDVWLDQDGICRLFERDQSVVSRHILKIYKDGEAGEGTFRDTTKVGATVKNAGRAYRVREYNLDVILSVGYKVNGKR